MKKAKKKDLAKAPGLSSGGRTRTDGLWVMSPTSYHCSTPQYDFIWWKQLTETLLLHLIFQERTAKVVKYMSPKSVIAKNQQIAQRFNQNTPTRQSAMLL